MGVIGGENPPKKDKDAINARQIKKLANEIELLKAAVNEKMGLAEKA